MKDLFFLPCLQMHSATHQPLFKYAIDFKGFSDELKDKFVENWHELQLYIGDLENSRPVCCPWLFESRPFVIYSTHTLCIVDLVAAYGCYIYKGLIKDLQADLNAAMPCLKHAEVTQYRAVIHHCQIEHLRLYDYCQSNHILLDEVLP